MSITQKKGCDSLLQLKLSVAGKFESLGGASSGGAKPHPIEKILLSSLEGKMEGILFMVFWIGSAALHTLYDLKIKPRLQALEEEQSDYPRF